MNINRAGLGNINISKAAEDKVLGKDINKDTIKDAGKDDAALKKVCKDFESIFVNILFKSMRDTVPKSEPFGGEAAGGGMAKETFQEMMDEELSKKIAQGRGIGLADMLYRQLSKKNKSVEDNDAGHK